MKRFDLIVFGSGPAGSSIAKKVAAQGHRVATIEGREFGGTCALRGCNPKKVYVNAGDLIDRVRRADGLLINDPGVAIDWNQLQAFKRQFTDPVREGSEQSFIDAGIATFLGDARFVARDRIELAGETLQADRFAIATGAKPRSLPFPGSEYVTHSDAFLELETLPKRVVFIGGGYISMEFAHVAARYDTNVRIVERSDRLLAGFDPDLTSMLKAASERIGIPFTMNQEVTKITQPSDGTLRVWLGETETIDCDLVVHGAGRVPNIDRLDLDAGQIEHNEHGVCVNEYLQSRTNEQVFAAGDCAASALPKLTPAANDEARTVTKNLFSESLEAVTSQKGIPMVAFTSPKIASVGLSESAARQSVDQLDVRFDDMSSWGSVRKTGETAAAYKILIDASNDRIVGAHLLGPAAEETINLFALAIKHDLSADDLKSTLFVFPTFASDVRNMF